MKKKGLEILLRYKSYSRATQSFNKITEEEFKLAKEEGFMFDKIMLSHNQSVDWLIEARKKVKKTHVTSCFISSLLSNRLDWRCGLSAYVLSMHYPHHSYTYEPSNELSTCSVCGEYVLNDFEEIDLSFYNSSRFRNGIAICGDEVKASLLAFCLEQHSQIPEFMPSQADIKVFKGIIEVISQAKFTDTPNDLEKSLAAKKLFKSNHWQRRHFLETLGFCNILEHPKARGYTANFVPPNKRYKNDHLSEWDYPIRLWRGQYGINQKAIDYWFGEFF